MSRDQLAINLYDVCQEGIDVIDDLIDLEDNLDDILTFNRVFKIIIPPLGMLPYIGKGLKYLANQVQNGVSKLDSPRDKITR
jgi:hypothetical protein